MLRAGAAKASALFFYMILKTKLTSGLKNKRERRVLMGFGFNVDEAAVHGHNFAVKAEPNPRILRLGGVKGEKNFINRLRDDIHTVVAKLGNRALMLVEVS